MAVISKMMNIAGTYIFLRKYISLCIKCRKKPIRQIAGQVSFTQSESVYARMRNE